MTNLEHLSSLTSEEAYEIMRWLFFEYGRMYTLTREAIIEWLEKEVE